jgi:Domain of unknown function (DUF4389)
VPQRLRVRFDTDLRRRRVLVLIRLLAAIPALAVLAVWTVLAAAVLLVGWVVVLAAARLPGRAHRFLRSYVAYAAATSAWLNLVTRRYPRLLGADRAVTVVAELERQPRLAVLLRPLLALPSIVLGSSLGVVLALSAVAAWFVALVRGRTTEGLRELGAFCVRYQVEALAFLLLVTPRAPRLAPPPD